MFLNILEKFALILKGKSKKKINVCKIFYILEI